MNYSRPNPTIRCSKCGEAVFGKPRNTKKVVICQQCGIAANATRKIRGRGRAGLASFWDPKPLNKRKPSV